MLEISLKFNHKQNKAGIFFFFFFFLNIRGTDDLHFNALWMSYYPERLWET